MARCARCSAPTSICVCGYTRKSPKRRRKHTRKAPTGRYWVCESSGGRSCGVHHRTMTAAYNHVRKLRRKARASAAYISAGRRRKAKATDWHIAPRGG